RHHHQHRVQPDRCDADARLGEADDGRAVADLAGRGRPRDRAGGQRLQLMAEERRHTRIDWLSTLLLALAAVATAWSTYQSAQWRGEQAANTGKSTAARIQSAEASTRAGQQTQVDIATFVQWANATQAGDAGLARFYRQRFRPEFRPAFDAWIAT